MKDWPTLQNEVTQSLVGLSDGDFLVLRTGPPAPRRRFRRPDPALEPAYVQAMWLYTVLTVEASPDAEIESLRALVWQTPENGPPWMPPGIYNLWREWPADGGITPEVAAEVAALAVATLRGPFGVAQASQVNWLRGPY